MTPPLSTDTPAGIDQGSAPFPELLPPQNIGTAPDEQQHHCGQDAEPAPTLDDVIKAFQVARDMIGQQPIVELVRTNYKVDCLRDIPPERYAEVLLVLKELVAVLQESDPWPAPSDFAVAAPSQDWQKAIDDAAQRVAETRLEAAVGLAVGYTLLTTALPFTELKVTFSPTDLDMFIRAYKVNQEIGEDGSLTISVEARI